MIACVCGTKIHFVAIVQLRGKETNGRTYENWRCVTSAPPTIDARIRMDDMGMMISDDAVKVSREGLGAHRQSTSERFILLY